VSADKVAEVLHASCKDYFIHAGCKRHITPQGPVVATGPVKFVVAALRRLDWAWKTGGRLDRLHSSLRPCALLCGGCLGGPVGCCLVVTGARCPLTKPVVAAVEQPAATEPHCSRGVQPGGIYVHVVQREPTPGGSGCKRPPGWLPPWFCVYCTDTPTNHAAPAIFSPLSSSPPCRLDPRLLCKHLFLINRSSDGVLSSVFLRHATSQ
jgi:hypothetical protein